jgi:hypothetical protein
METPSTTQQIPARKSGKLAVLIVLATSAIASGVIYLKRPISDAALSAMLIGKWKAVDPSNKALHHRNTPVTSEEVWFEAGGKVTYLVAPGTDGGPPKVEPWAWEVKKGKLLLRDMGQNSAQDKLPSIRFKVGRSELSINRKSFPTKVFQRVSS